MPYADIEERRAYDRMRRKLPHRMAMDARRQRRRRREQPDKCLARRKVNDAIKCGWIERKPCEDCGDPKSEAHHEDYSKPLDVKWLCQTHHRERHSVPRETLLIRS